MEVLLTDEIAILNDIGQNLLNELLYKFFTCRYCYQYFRLLKDVRQSMNNHSESNIKAGDNSSTDPNVLFYSLWYTDEVCQLHNLTNHALELAGSLIKIRVNGNRTISFKVALSKENDLRMIRNGTMIFESRRFPDCFVTYKLKREVVCPEIRISFSEFEPYMTEHNADIMKSMFTTVQMRSKEYKEICVADYIEKLDDGNFDGSQNSCSFQRRVQIAIFINTMAITQMI